MRWPQALQSAGLPASLLGRVSDRLQLGHVSLIGISNAPATGNPQRTDCVFQRIRCANATFEFLAIANCGNYERNWFSERSKATNFHCA